MEVDNASDQVIEQTRREHLEYVRLYFRPRTPTQFRNEGIRPVGQRELNAHCPVPVFFCFDAQTILSEDHTEFSAGNMARSEAEHSAERDFFLSIPFNLVFHDGWFSPENQSTIIYHRNAEVLVPTSLALDSSLASVVCRSVAERRTLLHLLPPDLRSKWWKRIRLGEAGFFERRWTFVEEVVTDDERVSFRFNPNSQTPGPFQVAFSYQEEGQSVRREWSGEVGDVSHSPLEFLLRDAKQGTATLYLDDALAFAGWFSFEDIPF